jgi:hypothetical protein
MPHYLLTGAGFSYNWGGWLAIEAFEYLLGAPRSPLSFLLPTTLSTVPTCTPSAPMTSICSLIPLTPAIPCSSDWWGQLTRRMAVGSNGSPRRIDTSADNLFAGAQPN